MATERKTKASVEPAELGLTAIGSSGPWEIAVDESTSGAHRWFAQIDGPLVYVRFELASLEIIDHALEFLRCSSSAGSDDMRASSPETLAVGAGDSEVLLCRDDEFGDRFFLVVRRNKGPLTRLTIGNDDLTHLVAALQQVAGDMC